MPHSNSPGSHSAAARPLSAKPKNPAPQAHNRRWQDKRTQMSQEADMPRHAAATGGSQIDDSRSAHDDSHRDPVRDTRAYSLSRDMLS